MATFSQVKDILNRLISTEDFERVQLRHGGERFGWATAAALRSAVAAIAGNEFWLIAADCIGNGKANETYLIRLLSGPIEEEGLPRMPFELTPATAEEIRIIRDWINEGAQDDRTKT
jgi:hypothetical protein